MSASNGLRVNIYERALTEPRIRRIARKLQLSHYEVLGRLTYLWMLCYQRRTPFVGIIDAEIAVGELPGFVEAIISEELADRVNEHELRVRGAEDAIRLLEVQAEKGRKSGEARRRAMSDALQKRTAVQPGFNWVQDAAQQADEPMAHPHREPDLICSDLPETGSEKINSSLLESGSPPGGDDAAPPPSKTQPGASGAAKRASQPLTPEAIKAATLLITLVTSNNPSGRLARAPRRLRDDTVTRWADTLRKLAVSDGVGWTAVDDMIRWCQADDFWRTVILGADNLRAHWDAMCMQRNRRPTSAPRRSEPRPGPTELAMRDVERAGGER